MSERPSLPPLYRPLAVASDVDPFAHGIDLAAADADPGTLVWSQGEAACECALVLAPEHSLKQSFPVVQVLMLGIGDALGALIPPVVAVTYGWPDRIEVNGGLVGGVRLAWPESGVPDAVPDWMVAGFGIALRGGWGEDRSNDLHRTTLQEEGCGDVTALDLLETFSRHFLSWINRWQDSGIEPVHQAWLSRATGLGKAITFEVNGHVRDGIFSGLGDTGALRLLKNGITQTVALDDAMKIPTWAV